MKKILFIISLIAVASSVTAQSGYYHQVGDTVRGKCPIYQYEQNWWPTLNAIGQTDSMIGTIYTFGYMKHTTNTPLKVIGVASTCARLRTSNFQEDMDTSIDGTLYYVLFDATAGGLVERARVCWSDDYMTHPKRYMELPRRGGATTCEGMFDNTTIVSLREYYFDSAITVTDSFYLGCDVPDINASGPNGFAIISYVASHRWDYSVYFTDLDSNSTQHKNCETEIPTFTYYDSSRLDNTWHHFTHKRFQLVFPIIEVDTFCVTPDEPQVADRDSLRVRVEWTDVSNLSWEVSRTAPGGDPNTGLITPTTVPYIEYTDIDNDSAYHVYVRGYCETLSNWSDWSTPCLIDSIPDSVGIATIETADFTLSPNPTSMTVTVETDQPSTLTLTDATGHDCGQWKVGNGKTTLDISPLPAGVYFVRLSTSSTMRKLIIR